MAAPLPSVHCRRPSEWHSLRSRLSKGRSPWSTSPWSKNASHSPNQQRRVQNSNSKSAIEDRIRSIARNGDFRPNYADFESPARSRMHARPESNPQQQIVAHNNKAHTSRSGDLLLHHRNPEFRLRMPDSLMECSESDPNANHEIAGTFRPSDADSMHCVGASARPHPAPAPKPLDAWFFEAAGVGCACPRPVGLVASRQLNRRLKRGGLSFGSAGWARSAAQGCRAAVRRWFTRRGTCNVRHASGQKDWITHAIVGMGAHVCPCLRVKRQDIVGRSCQNTDRNVTECSGLNTSKVLRLQLSDFSTTTNPIESIQKPIVS